MPATFVCPHGHAFDSAPGAISRSCPICGAPVNPESVERSLPSTVQEHLDATGPFTGPAPESAEGTSAPLGYELIRLLGQGGMGVVYQARQIGFNRIVALKMIRAGGRASEQERSRFRTEAEAVARLSHPNIVQVFEIGTHLGQPYFSLEYCAGGSLRDQLREHPLTPAEAAVLVGRLARAMETAHRAGVLHRDLKPANVLLSGSGESGEGRVASGVTRQQSPQGISPGPSPLATAHSPLTPKIADFGLAKKLDDEGQTVPGAVLGTPSYMAPEQARGENVGPLADVYALGAILYECLTGRPPFRAATVWETVGQVLNAEVVSPRQLNGKVPRDLDTICLKCLQKDPGRRYDSAVSLAEDLERYQRGEPIRARPVGVLERVGKWVRRNPTVASLAAAVAVLLVVGTGVSITLAVLAWQRLQALTVAYGDLDTARQNLSEKETLVTRREGELAVKQEELDDAEARICLRPLSPTDPPVARPNPLTEAEGLALRDLARNRARRPGPRLVREALSESQRLAQLARRGEVALHAAVGFDEEARSTVERLLLEGLRDEQRPEGDRGRIAYLLLELGGTPAATDQAALTYLHRRLVNPKRPFYPMGAAARLAAVLPRLTPKMVREQVDILLPELQGQPVPLIRAAQAEAMTILAERLPPVESAPLYRAAFRALLGDMLDASRPAALTTASQLIHLLPRIGRAEHAHFAAELTGIIAKWTPASGHRDSAAIMLLAGHLREFLTPSEAQALAEALTHQVIMGTNSRPMFYFSHELNRIGSTLTPADAAPLARRLVASMGQKAVPTQVAYRLEGLTGLLTAVTPAERPLIAEPIRKMLVEASVRTDPLVQWRAFACVDLIVAGLESGQAAALVSEIFSGLSPQALRSAGPKVIHSLGRHFAPGEALRLARAVVRDMGTRDQADLVAVIVAPLVPWIERDALPALGRDIIRGVESAPDPGQVNGALGALEEIVARVSGPEADALRLTASEAVVNVLTRSPDPFITLGSRERLVRVVTATPEAGVDALAWRLANDLAGERLGHKPQCSSVVALLQALLARTSPAQAERIAGRLATNMAGAPSYTQLTRNILPCWQDLVPRLSSAALNQVAEDLIQGIEREPRETNIFITRALQAVLVRQPPDVARPRAERAARVLVGLLNSTTNPYSKTNLTSELVLFLPHVHPTLARSAAEQALAVVTSAAQDADQVYNRRTITRAQYQLAPYLSVAEGAAQIEKATTLLIESLHRANLAGSDETERLADVLVGAAPVLSAGQRETLLRSLFRGPIDPRVGSRVIRAMLAGMPLLDLPRSVAGLLSERAAIGLLPGAVLTVLGPCELSDGSILEVLAEPLCTGEARRTLLTALELRHGRRFLDHWEASRFLRQ